VGELYSKETNLWSFPPSGLASLAQQHPLPLNRAMACTRPQDDFTPIPSTVRRIEFSWFAAFWTTTRG
jgi:hypothetical protein